MSLRIKKLLSTIESHPLRGDRIIVSAAGSHHESVYLSLAIEDHDGYVGFGEAAVSPLWSGETTAGSRNLVDHLFAPLLSGATFDHPSECAALLDRTIIGWPFTKSAIDVALWDLWAKRMGSPAWSLFGDRTPVESIPTRASIGAYSPEKTRELARELWNAGVRTLKFKVGVPGIDDIARLREVRRELDFDVTITVDYNGAFSDPNLAVAHIGQLLPFGLALVEQPIHRDRISAMAEVHRRIDVPLMIDEGVFNRAQLSEAIALDAFDIVSIYPGKNGGLSNSLDMVATAMAAGKRCAIGSNLETDIGQAAMLSLSASLSAFSCDELHGDLMSPLYYSSSSITEPLRMDEGRVIMPTGPGFGVVPNCFASVGAATLHQI